jgi:hypothetical protein
MTPILPVLRLLVGRMLASRLLLMLLLVVLPRIVQILTLLICLLARLLVLAIYDAASAGNLLVHGTLTANKTLDAGDTLRIATGDLDISID